MNEIQTLIAAGDGISGIQNQGQIRGEGRT